MKGPANNQAAITVDDIQETVLENLYDGVYVVDRRRRILYWNKAAEQLSGYRASEVIGSCCADGILQHVDRSGRCLCRKGCPLAATMRDGKCRSEQIFMHHKDGHRVPVSVRSAPIRASDGRIIGSVEVFADETERYKTSKRLRELERTAFIDELTGIGNRRFFNCSLEGCAAFLDKSGVPYGVLMIDIDNFKAFNDTFGHAAGDKVLVAVARTLSCVCREGQTPCRWGGEEFAVLVESVEEPELLEVGEHLRAMIAETTADAGGQRLAVTASVGGAVARPGEAPDVLERADAMLYASKQAGRDRVSV